MPGSAVVRVRRFPTGRAQSYAGKIHVDPFWIVCRLLPQRIAQIRSAFATRTHGMPRYHAHQKARSPKVSQSSLQKGPHTGFVAHAAEQLPYLINMHLTSGGTIATSLMFDSTFPFIWSVTPPDQSRSASMVASTASMRSIFLKKLLHVISLSYLGCVSIA